MGKDAAVSVTGKRPGLFYGYVVVAALFLVLAVIHGVVQNFGVFFKPMSEEFGWTRAQTSGALSISWFVLGGVNVIAGRLNDRLGPRLLVSGGGVLMGLGFILLSRMDALWQLYLLYGLPIAIGMSSGYVPAMATVARWFVQRRGLMTGIVVAGVGAGTMVGAPVLSSIIAGYGWRTAFLVAGITTVALLVIFAQFIKREPEEMGLSPYGSAQPAAPARQHESPVYEVRGPTLRSAMLSRQFWLLCIIYLTFGLGLQGIGVHIVPYATDRGIPAIAAANIMALIGATNIFGRIALGWVSDRIGNRTSIIITASLSVVSLLWLLWAREDWMLYLFAVIFGLGHAGQATLASPMVAELFGMRWHGALLGVLSLIWSSGGATSPIIMGYIFDVTGSYHRALVISVALAVACLVMTIFLKPAKERA